MSARARGGMGERMMEGIKKGRGGRREGEERRVEGIRKGGKDWRKECESEERDGRKDKTK